MIGEIDCEIAVNVIFDFFVVMFFVMVLLCDPSLWLFTKERLYCPPFMNIPYIVGNFFSFPTSRCWIVEVVTMGGGCGGVG